MAGTVLAPAAENFGAEQRRRPRRGRLAMAAAFVSVALVGGGVGAYLGLQRHVSLSNLMALSPVPLRPAPGFTLVDQNGHPVSLSALRGRAVVLNFFDDRCTTLCPVISEELINAAHDLGAQANDVAFVAVNVNTAFLGTSWVRTFTNQHGLGALPHWYFVTGSTAALEAVWRSYQVSVQVDPTNGSVFHSSPMYFIDPRGRERAVAAPTSDVRANQTGYLPPVQLSEWGQGIAREVRSLL